MRYISSVLITVVLIGSPLLVSAQADPHTNITPIEDQVVQNIDAFTKYVQSGDLSREELSEAISDLRFVLNFYLDTLN
jgi:hypothetical protein